MSEFNHEPENTTNPAIRIAEIILVIGFILAEEIILKRLLKPVFDFFCYCKNKFNKTVEK